MFDAACLALDLGALDAAGRADEAVRVRTGAEEFLWALECTNPSSRSGRRARPGKHASASSHTPA